MVQMPKVVKAAESTTVIAPCRCMDDSDVCTAQCEPVTMQAVMDRIGEAYGPPLEPPPCPWDGIRNCDWADAWAECLEEREGLPTPDEILAKYHAQHDERHGSRVRP